MFDAVERVGLLPEQVTVYNLPYNPDPEVEKKLERDSRAAAFRERHGSLVQYEMDALAPDVLRGLYQDAIDSYWDQSEYAQVLEREEQERAEL